MLNDLDPAARALADYMSELSEQAYCAGWMDSLEFALWDAVASGPRKYGQMEVTAEHVTRLRRLADAAGGWIVFDDVNEESLCPLREWEQRYAVWKTSST